MSLRHCIGTAAVLTLLLACSSPHEQEGDYAERVRAAMVREHVPGVAIAILKNCRLESVLSLGVADKRSGAAVTKSTLFEAASLTKPVFAYLFLQKVDSGILSLDDPLSKTFTYPRVADNETFAKLTPRLILTHRTGLPNWASKDSKTGEPGPLSFSRSPGTRFGYSGEAFEMLQSYFEARLGAPFESAFAEVLGGDMPDSAVGQSNTDGVTEAYGHDKHGRVKSGRPLSAPEKASTAHSLRTVAADYARFTGRVCRGDGLGAELHEDMLRPQSPAPIAAWRSLFSPLGGDISWGLGWGTLTTAGRTIHFHWGDNGPFKSLVAFDRKTGDGVVYFANAENGLELIRAIGDPVFGISLEPIARWVN